MKKTSRLIAGACVAFSACSKTPSPSTAPLDASKVAICSLPQGQYSRYSEALSGSEAGIRSLKAVEAVYSDAFEKVSQHYTERSYEQLEACCANVRSDPIAFEYCSAATALAKNENDPEKLANAMPRTVERIDASNELDLILGSDHARQLRPNVFALYYSRLWKLAHAGDLRIIDNFMLMAEKSHGVHAEGAEIMLCRVRRELPERFASGILPSQHPRLIAELRQRCASVLEYEDSLEAEKSR